MKHYIDQKTQQIFAYEDDGSQDDLIGDHLSPIGDAELTAARAPTIEEITALLKSFVRGHLDNTAIALGYDGIFTAVTYADEDAVPAFQAEAKALRAWRSSVWARCYELVAEVEIGSRSVPDLAALIDLLPPFEAPQG